MFAGYKWIVFDTFLNNYRQNEEIRLRQAIIREATTDYIDEMNI